MHTRYLAAAALLLGSIAVLAPSCAAPVESPDDGAGGALMSPMPAEPIGEAQDALQICECSVDSDWCPWTVGGRCVIGFNSCTKTPLRGCGLGGLYACTGWCVRP